MVHLIVKGQRRASSRRVTILVNQLQGHPLFDSRLIIRVSYAARDYAATDQFDIDVGNHFAGRQDDGLARTKKYEAVRGSRSGLCREVRSQGRDLILGGRQLR